MSQSEFERWAQFYEMAPFDDLHRFHRPAALLAVKMAGGEIADMLEWLQDEKSFGDGELSTADLKTLAAFGVKPTKEKESRTGL